MRALLALLVLSLAGAGVRAAAPQPAAGAGHLPAVRVQDLHYGDVLFHFYAGEEFEALTRLEAYAQWDRMPSHRRDAALLAGGLYLTLGMHNEAGRRFEQLLTPDVPAGVRDRAWFYLARIWYARGYYDRSEQALARIGGPLEPVAEAERQHLLVNDLMRQGRFDEAAQRLAHWQGPLDWMAYARFNLGVALVRQNRMADADPVLTAVGTLDAGSEALLALRDKANLALGFAWLQAGNPAAGRAALERVRLAGPYASRALLGVGWAAAAQGDYRAALTPWLALGERDLQDPAVQESLLAVPYAFAKLGAGGQAVQYYESALQAYGAEADRLAAAIVHVGSGHMLADLLGSQPEAPGAEADHNGPWQLQQLPVSTETRYLYALLADNDFQEGLKNYRDLGFLGGRLARWDESMEAFAAMIETRQLAEQRRLPEADALLARDAAGQLLMRRTALDDRLTMVETDNDVAALGEADERAQWLRVRRLEAALTAALGNTPADAGELQVEREKIRLMKGVLYWQLDAKFRERSYADRRALRALDEVLNEAQNRFVRVRQARATVPVGVDAFAARIAALGTRIATLRERLRDAADQQEHFLARLAQEQLQAQKDRLTAYQVQARFALADLYDRAGNDRGAPAATPAATPTPRPAPEAEPVPAPAPAAAPGAVPGAPPGATP